MSLATRTFYVQASQSDVYRQWKSFLGMSETAEPGHEQGMGCALLREVPDQEVLWLTRWGMANIAGKADFIPADGGCVVYVSMDGIDSISRLILSAMRPLAVGPWRNIDAVHFGGDRIS